MDAELKAKWVAALRSGEYEQASDSLHDQEQGGYCCLGVLCKVMGATFGPFSGEDEGEWHAWDYVPFVDGRVLSAGEDQELKKSLCQELGIPDQTALSGMNDGTGKFFKNKKTFPEIADYIEANL